MQLYPFFIPHAGCPHRCLFCSQQHTIGPSGRVELPSPDEIAGALDRILPPSGGGEVAFYGGTFTLLPMGKQEACLEAVAPFIRSGRVDGIRVSTRPDALPREATEWLASRHVTTVELGCQSFSADVLRKAGRGHDERVSAEAVRRLRRAGIRVGLQLMPGLPGGSRHEAMESLAAALCLSPDFLRIYPTVVLRDTALEQLMLNGGYHPLGLEEAVDWCAEMLWHCREQGTPVIRLGLQATPELDSGRMLVSGPYHPAFGQLVRSRLWLRALKRAGFAGVRLASVHPAELSDALGHRRANLLEVQREFGGFTLDSQPDLARGTLSLAGRHHSLQELSCYQRDTRIGNR